MAYDDNPSLRPSDRHIEAPGVVREAYTSCGVCADEGDDHEVSLLSLSCVDGADYKFPVVAPGEPFSEHRVLSPVRRQHQDSRSTFVLAVHAFQQVLYCSDLHLVGRGAAVFGFLSAAVKVQDAVAWDCFITHDVCVRRAWSVRSFLFRRPWDAFDEFRPFPEATQQGIVVVLHVGEALDVGVHAVLDNEHDDVVEAVVRAVETGKQ